jgi:hypothetical protein
LAGIVGQISPRRFNATGRTERFWSCRPYGNHLISVIAVGGQQTQIARSVTGGFALIIAVQIIGTVSPKQSFLGHTPESPSPLI